MKITVNIRKIVIGFGAAIAFLFAAHLFVSYERFVKGHGQLLGLTHLFDLNEEQNFPTWYQSVTLLAAGVLAGIVARCKAAAQDRFAGHWTGLTVILTAMSVDEFVSMHEFIGENIIATKMHWEGRFDFLWLAAGIPFVVFFGAVYLRFFFALPAPDRTRFALAGAFYLAGVVGLELVGGCYSMHHGHENMVFALWSGLEELCEMIGVLFLNAALLCYLRTHACPRGISFEIAQGSAQRSRHG